MTRNSKTSRVTLLVAALAVAGAALGYWLMKPVPAAPASADAETPSADAASAQPAPAAPDDAELRPQSPAERAYVSHLPAAIQAVSRPAPASATAAPQPEPTAYTRQLVSSLTNLDLSHGPITKEQAEQWKQGMQTLVAQGTAALPAIREFLAQNQELNFGAIAGGDQLG